LQELFFKLREIRKKVLRGWIYPILGFVILIPYLMTVRKKILGADMKPWKQDRTKAYLYGSWHEDIVVGSVAKSYSKICTMASYSRDGEVAARMCQLLGYKIVRGTCDRGWREAFEKMIIYATQGWNLGLTVDGPKGPRHEVKPGIIKLGKEAGIQLLPSVANAQKKYVFEKSWDKLWIPYPFTRAVVIIGDPISLEGADTMEALEEKRVEFHRALDALKAKANAYF
jgi:lysophospholipid acyltransferase (LPLAT)-like uncharacterized protein